MDFRILGPVEVRENGRLVPLGGGKQRVLLALLLLNANRVVSRDALIDQLWGERPPATAATALQGHISGLRKALGPDAIATRSPGYVLEVEAEHVDLYRFEQLCDEARAALDEGDTGAVAAKLRAALELWHGPALADIRFERAIDAESARLENLRLAALEDRIDADLATRGVGADLVGELERLVASHPLRERLWEQLMVALYRSGRQADALSAYRRARESFVSELGIEPAQSLRDLERRMLEQDPALDRRPRTVGEARRPPVRLAMVLLGIAVICAALAAVALIGRDSDAPAVPLNGLAIVDPGKVAVVGSIPLDSRPGPIAAGAGAVWVVSPGSSTITRVDPRARRLVHTRGIGGAPGNVAASADEVWIADFCTNGGVPGTLDHIFTTLDGGGELDSDATPLDGAFPARDPRLNAAPQAPPQCGLAARGQSAWVATNVPPGLARIDFDRTAVDAGIVRAIPLRHAPAAIAIGAGSVWAVDSVEGVVRRIDPRNGRVLRIIRVGNDPHAIAAGAGAVWVANQQDGAVSRIDPRTSSVTKAISVGEQPVAVAIGEGSIWVANSADHSLSQLDPRTNQVVQTIPLGRSPQGVAVAGRAVWVTVRP